MVYFVGIIGFIGGFMVGLYIIGYILKGRTNEELVNDQALRWKYGILNWLIAFLGCASALWIYDNYFW